jgi:hypothetical protein
MVHQIKSGTASSFEQRSRYLRIGLCFYTMYVALSKVDIDPSAARCPSVQSRPPQHSVGRGDLRELIDINQAVVRAVAAARRRCRGVTSRSEFLKDFRGLN